MPKTETTPSSKPIPVPPNSIPPHSAAQKPANAVTEKEPKKEEEGTPEKAFGARLRGSVESRVNAQQIRNRKALLVAINEYQPSPNRLNSCVNDAQAVGELLTGRYGFKPEDIYSLLDGQAHRTNVLAGLRWLMDGATEEDCLVFFFSGHGYSTTGEDGLARECLVLADLNDNRWFYDEEFSRATQALPEGALTLIIDACHSGGMNKNFEFDPQHLLTVKVGPEAERARVKVFVEEQDVLNLAGFGEGPRVAAAEGAPAQKSLSWSQPEQQHRPVQRFGQAIRSPDTGAVLSKAFLPESVDPRPHVNGVLLAACRADQTAAAGTRATRNLSAFTYSLLRFLDANPATSYSGFIQFTQNVMRSELRYTQVPELSVSEQLQSWAPSRALITQVPAAPTSKESTMQQTYGFQNPFPGTQFLGFGGAGPFTKDFSSNAPAAGAEKGWMDVLQHLATTAPQLIGPALNMVTGSIAAAQKGYQAPGSAGGAEKGWMDVITHLATTAPQLIGPVVNMVTGGIAAAQKGYQAPAVAGAEKGWVDVLQHLATTAPQLIGPVVNMVTGGIAAAQKGYQAPAAAGAEKGWVDVLQHLATTAPQLIAPALNMVTGSIAAAQKGYQAPMDKGLLLSLLNTVVPGISLLAPVANALI